MNHGSRLAVFVAAILAVPAVSPGFSVISSSPNRFINGISVTPVITLQFDDTIDTNTVSALTFTVRSLHQGPINGTYSFPAVDLVSFAPDETLLYADQIFIDVTTNVLSGGGTGVMPYSSFFHTIVADCSLLSYVTNSLIIDTVNFSPWNEFGDLDNDGDPDAIVGDSQYGFEVWFNKGNGDFIDSGKKYGQYNNSSNDAKTGDVDGDGDIDIVEINNSQSLWYVWKNDGNGFFTIAGTNNIDSLYGLNIGDLDADGDLDVFLGRHGGDQVWLNDGSGNYTDSGQSLGDAGHRTFAVELADFDGDGDLDAFTGVGIGNENKLWANNGDGTFVDSGIVFTNLSASSAATGDTDNDGDIDLFVSYSGANILYINNGSGVLSNSQQALNNLSGQDVEIIDMNGDGWLDAVTTPFNNRAVVHLNDGTGVLTNNVLILAKNNTHDMSFADVDGDGDGDILAGYSSSFSAELWINDGCRDISVVKTADKITVYPGSDITYTLTVSNRSIFAATNVVVTDTFPSTASYVSDSENCIYSNGVLTCQLGDMLPFASTSITVVVSTETNLLIHVTNRAEVTMLEAEIGTNNNTSIAVTPPTPFSYNSVDPENGEAFATISNSITVVLNYEVNQSSVNSNTFILRGRKTPLHSGNFIWPNATTLVFDASTPFAYHDQLSLTLTDGITNPEGRPFTPCSLNFRTKAGFTCIDFTLYQRINRVNSATGQPNSHRLGDLDGDGDIDAFVNGSGKAHTFINDGNGNFTVGWSGPSISSALGVGMGDLDNDGDLDIFRGGENWSGKTIEILMNDGSGNFTPTGQQITNSLDRVRMADIDNDGDLDAVTTSSFYSDVIAYTNDGTGYFTEHQIVTFNASYDHRLADMDDDGDLDLIVTLNPTATTIFANDGAGYFTLLKENIGQFGGRYIDVGDVDGDGDLDVVQVDSSSSANRVLINDGNLNFGITQYLGSVGNGAVDITLGDFEGDGDLDLFTSPGKIYLNNGSGSFTELPLGIAQIWGHLVELADVDSDGDLDIFGISSQTPDGGVVFFNQGCLDICVDADISPASPAAGELVTYTINITNQSAFGANDILVTNIHPAGSALVSVQPAASVGSDRTIHAIPSLAPGQSTGIVIQIASDLLATGALINASHLGVPGDTNLLNQSAILSNALPADIIFRCIASTPTKHDNSVADNSSISVTLSEAVDPTTISNGTVVIRGSQRGIYAGTIGNPDSTTITFDPNSNFLPGERVNVTLTDGIRSLSGGKKLRLCSIEFTTEAQGCGEFQFNHIQTNVQTALHYDADLADMDGDGNLDVIVARLFSIGIYWGEGNGRVTNNGTSYTANSAQGVAVGDLNNDGHMDFVSAGGVGANILYFNDGTGVFTNQYQFPTTNYTTQIELGDLDGDGDLDIVELNRQFTGSEPSLWSFIHLNNGDGTFIEGPQQLLKASGEIFSGDIRDLDNDGDLDITINDYLGTASVYLNTGVGFFSLSDNSLTSTTFNGIADLNNDGLLDAVAYASFVPRVFTNDGNAYLSGPTNNNNFFASPRVVEFGDFDGDGDMDGYNIAFSSVTNRTWTNTAGTVFQYSNQPQQPKYNQTSASAGDMDGDGDLDLVLSGTSAFLILRHDGCTYGPVDTDGDGMPDDWELLHFGGNSGIATNHNDSDEFDNLSEYIADTIPTNGMSQFELVDFDIDTNGEISFDSSAARIYTVQCATNLMMPDWENVIEDEPGVGGQITLEVTNSAVDAYYRVIVELP